MLMIFDFDEYVYCAMRVGVCGFLFKDMLVEDIVVVVC